MDYPTLDQVRQLRDAEMATRADNRRPLLPLCCDILADMETPVSAYCKTAKGPYSFLLESVTGGEHIARYSFIGIDPYLVMTHHGDKVTLRSIQGVEEGAGKLTPLRQGLVGASACLRPVSLPPSSCYDPLEVI